MNRLKSPIDVSVVIDIYQVGITVRYLSYNRLDYVIYSICDATSKQVLAREGEFWQVQLRLRNSISRSSENRDAIVEAVKAECRKRPDYAVEEFFN